jgi:hypothetical protein
LNLVGSPKKAANEKVLRDAFRFSGSIPSVHLGSSLDLGRLGSDGVQQWSDCVGGRGLFYLERDVSNRL